MGDEIVVLPELLEYRRNHVQPAREEFERAAQDGHPTEDEARKYIEVLDEYAGKVQDSPHAPDSASVQPTTYDSAVRRGANTEMGWIVSEKSRVLGYFGGYLPPRMVRP